jgi:hypothetical protein
VSINNQALVSNGSFIKDSSLGVVISTRFTHIKVRDDNDEKRTEWNHKTFTISRECRIYGVTLECLQKNSACVVISLRVKWNSIPRPLCSKFQMINSTQMNIHKVLHSFVLFFSPNAVRIKCHAWQMALIKHFPSLSCTPGSRAGSEMHQCTKTVQHKTWGPLRVRVKWNFDHDRSTNTRLPYKIIPLM